MRLVFFGTPSLAVPSLERLVQDGRAPALVVARPDRPRGRGLHAARSPVGEAAHRLGLPVTAPERPGELEFVEQVRAQEPDLLIVIAYGRILTPALLGSARLGAINVHFSLLPRHRGASPIQAAILAGDRETGVTTMWMTEGLDEGPIFLARGTAIGGDEDAGSLGVRLAELGAACLAESLDRIEQGAIARTPQNPAGATYAPKIGRDAGRLTLEIAPHEFVRRVRAFTPDPGSWLGLNTGRLQVLAAAVAAEEAADRGDAGAVLAIDRARGIQIALSRGSVWLRRVRPGGRREMAAFDFANGMRLRPGDRLPLDGPRP